MFTNTLATKEILEIKIVNRVIVMQENQLVPQKLS